MSEALRGPRAGALAGCGVVAARELGAALDSGVAFVAAAGFALLANFVFMNEFFLTGRVDMGPWFAQVPYLFVLFLPAISMRAWAEERRTRTFETLLALPLEPWQLVLGKFLAALAILLLLLAGSAPIVVLLAWVGDPDGGLLAGGYVGSVALGALILAVGLAASACTRDQITAFVLSVLGAAFLVLSGHERLVSVADGLFPGVRSGTWLRDNVSALPHYERLARGVIDLPAAVYFAGATALALAANALVVARVRD